MERGLARRHSVLFKRWVRNPFSFVRDLYEYGKLRELFSFIVWELFHKLRLFPKERYLKFNNLEALTLEKGSLSDADFQERVKRFFSSRELSLVRSHHNWKLLFSNNYGEIFGCLYPDDRDLYKSIDHGESIVFVRRFPERIKSVFISSQNTIFVCILGAVYRSSDNGSTFKKIIDLDSSASYFRHNNAMTETSDGTLIIGEYGNVWEKRGWRPLAYLYFSSDNGINWQKSDFLIKIGVNKHIHLIKYSKLLNKIFMADGDNHKKLWVADALHSSELRDPNRWKPVNRFHIQMGGHTSVVESDEKIFFGTDYQGGTNFIVATADGERFEKYIVPDPYRRSPVDNMIQRRSKNGMEIWAHLPFSISGTKSLLMYTADGGKSWTKVLEYNRSDHVVSLLSSSIDIPDVIYFSMANSENTERIVYKIIDSE